MKKTLALLLSLAMLFTVLSVNVFAESPTAKVTVVADTTTNDTSNVGFAVKLSGFDSLKGVDLTITGTGLAFNDSVTATGLDTNLQKNVNYKASQNQIHIVELTNWSETADVTIKATANLEESATAPKITVTACELAKNGTALYTVGTDYTFNNEIPVASAIKEGTVNVGGKTKITQEDAGYGYFIPYGGVANNGESVKKDSDGSFVVNSTTKVKKFPKSANGITTFGKSDSKVAESPAKQFGTYVDNYDSVNKQYGSMVLVGDWNAFVSAYQGKYQDSYISEIVAKLYDYYDQYNPVGKYAYVNAKIVATDGTKYSVKIYKVAQNNYMWKNEGAGILEYAVRISGLKDGSMYTAVAYNADKGTGANPVFSAEIKSATYTTTSAQ